VSKPAKILCFGYGNPGRGDDAIGPELIGRTEALNLPDVECIHDMQLQVEDITELVGRELVLFIDADMSCTEPLHFSGIRAEKNDSYTSHAMSPHAILHAFRQVYGKAAPPTFLLRVRGYQFELGESLSTPAYANLEMASSLLQKLCHTSDIKDWHDSLSGD